MKKIILLSIVLIMTMTFLFALKDVSGTNKIEGSFTSPATAQSKVTFSLDSTGTSYMKFGFVNSLPAESSEPSAWAATVPLTFPKDGGSVATNSTPLFAWWHIIYGAPLKIEVGMTSALTNQNSSYSTDTINWGVYEGENELAESSTITGDVDSAYGKIGNHGEDGVIESWGNKQLTIKTTTTDFESLHTGSYESYLELKISTGN